MLTDNAPLRMPQHSAARVLDHERGGLAEALSSSKSWGRRSKVDFRSEGLVSLHSANGIAVVILKSSCCVKFNPKPTNLNRRLSRSPWSERVLARAFG